MRSRIWYLCYTAERYATIYDIEDMEESVAISKYNILNNSDSLDDDKKDPEKNNKTFVHLSKNWLQ